MNMTQTGRLIAQLRTALGMTQAELAQRLDVTDKAVSKWERGKVCLISHCSTAWRQNCG